MTGSFLLTVPDDTLEEIARRAAEMALEKIRRKNNDGFLTAKGAAEYLGLSTDAVYKLEQRKEIRGYRPNGSLFFDRAELAAWVRGAA